MITDLTRVVRPVVVMFWPSYVNNLRATLSTRKIENPPTLASKWIGVARSIAMGTRSVQPANFGSSYPNQDGCNEREPWNSFGNWCKGPLLPQNPAKCLQGCQHPFSSKPRRRPRHPHRGRSSSWHPYHGFCGGSPSL